MCCVNAIVSLLLICVTWSTGQQVCPEDGYPAGLTIPDHARPFADVVPVDLDSVFIMTTKGAVNCYGVVRAWRFGREPGACDDVTFMIWREDVTGTRGYRLVGQNTYTCDAPPTGFGGDVFTHLVPENQQIAVEPGDLLGWRLLSGGTGMLQYEDDSIVACPCGQVERIQFDNNPINSECMDTIQPGEYCGGPTAVTLTRDYSLQAIVYTALSPTIDNLDMRVLIYENEANIFTVEASQPSNELDPTYVMDNVVPLTFSLDPTERLFNINPNSGWISVLGGLDFEVGQLYVVPVWVTGHLRTTQAVLTVEMMDENEPHTLLNFSPNPVLVSAQATQPGDQIFKAEVFDPDIYNPSVISFYLSTAVPFDPLPFAVEKQTGVIHSTQNLHDWIGPTSYQLYIHAADHMFKDGPNTLIVQIQDTISAPDLHNMNASVDVYENVIPNSKIFQALVYAPYPDQVEFYINIIRPWQGHDFFHIDAANGEVFVTSVAHLDLLHIDTYHVEIQAKDHLQTSLAKNLTVNVQWSNQPPRFNPSSFTVLIPEKTYPYTFINLLVEDRDVDNNLPVSNPDTIHCDIIKGSHYYFEVDPLCTFLRVVQEIDVDTYPELMTLNLTLLVYDRTATDNATALVRIHVYDINDNSPVFNPVNYEESIEENTPGGVSILTVTATDRDMGVNAEITYSLRDPTGLATSYFQVGPATGILSTKQPIDYEEYGPSVSFQVIATDGGTPSRSDIANVLINIIDVNDNRPVWQCDNKEDDHLYVPAEQCFYNLEVRSDVFRNHTLMTVAATDADVITPNPIFFLLKPEEHVSLQPISGNITVEESLYNKHKYVLYAYARDQGEPELLSTPSIIRIDSFPKCTYMVDITLAITDEEFEPRQREFIEKLRNITHPWVIKIEPQGNYVDKTLATIYALRDASTFQFANLHTEKHFVGRYELMRRLRRNIYEKAKEFRFVTDILKTYSLEGDPNDLLAGPEFEDFRPTQVMPHCVIWWIDTVPGLATTSTLVFLLLLAWVILAICLCRRYKKLCFKDKPVAKSWSKEPIVVKEIPKKKPRRDSVDTVHSLIYDFQYGKKDIGSLKT